MPNKKCPVKVLRICRNLGKVRLLPNWIDASSAREGEAPAELDVS
jgi:hypothetical protein